MLFFFSLFVLNYYFYYYYDYNQNINAVNNLGDNVFFILYKRKKMDIRKEMITILDHNRFKKLSGKNNEEESILWTDIMMVITWTRQSNPLCSQQCLGFYLFSTFIQTKQKMKKKIFYLTL